MQQHAIILGSLSETNDLLLRRYLSAAREALDRLLSFPDLLADIHLDRVEGTYTRNLIFGDAQMSVWALRWAPGASTSIHDHHCSCCFAVLSGEIREIRFSAIDDRSVLKGVEYRRTPGFIASMLPSEPNIHQMRNDSSEEAISIHIYGYDHRMRSSSVHREYQQVQSCAA
jgi:predicted metal-dependent enzyme (double-stranded beta helix superfamily)